VSTHADKSKYTSKGRAVSVWHMTRGIEIERNVCPIGNVKANCDWTSVARLAVMVSEGPQCESPESWRRADCSGSSLSCDNPVRGCHISARWGQTVITFSGLNFRTLRKFAESRGRIDKLAGGRVQWD
jgi:hypothetical protein